MKMPPEQVDQIPRRIRDRLQAIDREIESLMAKAESRFLTEVPRRISFDMSSTTTTGDFITAYERAQSVSFVTRYENLPENVTLHLVEQDGDWYMQDLWVLRHVLNDFRPIIQNQKDAVYYAQIHRAWNQMLRRTDPTEGMIVKVLDETSQDITGPLFKVSNRK
jgi:hypothetical protein